ncbi:hypothetical protein F4859DRAFT_520392 [Xylaria cf. heliscus]|nr:hypothetical protein F4859DRAFT_520392 [Xylaria cf. heliscus]
MRILLLLIAAAALHSGIPTAAAAAFASPQSSDNVSSGSVADQSLKNDTEGVLDHPDIPDIPGPIPVHDVFCTGSKLDRTDLDVAYNKSVAYYDTQKMPGGSARLFQYETAMWAICNCKHDWAVGCPEAELRHADQLITAQCGEDYSGRVVGFPP